MLFQPKCLSCVNLISWENKVGNCAVTKIAARFLLPYLKNAWQTDRRTDRRMDRQMDRRTDKASYRVACPQLKSMNVETARRSFITAQRQDTTRDKHFGWNNMRPCFKKKSYHSLGFYFSHDLIKKYSYVINYQWKNHKIWNIPCSQQGAYPWKKLSP